MTSHVHDHDNLAADPVGQKRARPRWLLPALIVAIGAGTLVVSGVLPLSTVVYAGLFGGMIFMHLGGHGGHGGHVGHSSRGSGNAEPGEDVHGDEANDENATRGCH